MFDPPSLPAAGWYPDPHRPGFNRWWNGRTWEQRWDGGSRSGDLPDIGAWLGTSFNCAIARWRAILMIGVIAGAVPGALLGLGASRLAADVVITDDEIIGWSNDRLPAAIALLLAAATLSFVGQLSTAVLMLRTVDGEPAASPTTAEFARGLSAIGAACRVLPRAIGYFLLIVLCVLVAMISMILLLFVAVGLGVIGILAFGVATIYLGVRLACLTQSVVDRPGQPFSRAMAVTKGRWWSTLGRLLLLGIIVWLASTAVQLAGSAMGGGSATNLGGSPVEFNSDGTIARIELAELFPSSPWALTVAAIVATLTMLVTSVAPTGMAVLYRTRNPPR